MNVGVGKAVWTCPHCGHTATLHLTRPGYIARVQIEHARRCKR